MSTTTIRLPPDLKARVAMVAKQAGKSAHSFMLEAIAQKADEAERRGEFQEVAEKRYAALLASGRTVTWSEMRAYLQEHAAGKSPRRPVAKKLAR